MKVKKRWKIKGNEEKSLRPGSKAGLGGPGRRGSEHGGERRGLANRSAPRRGRHKRRGDRRGAQRLRADAVAPRRGPAAKQKRLKTYHIISSKNIKL